MPEFKFTNSELLWIAAWATYALIYCVVLAYLLNRRRFETEERILWFLVITFAPVIGIVLFILTSKDDKIPENMPESPAPIADKIDILRQNSPGHTAAPPHE